ncbi:MAG TPA: response regulator transcription factor [Bryobacteraceae bacterium]|jgi:DNA-binding NarL/FixJ family response regulator|nr:response regulator transcription factor [Bryobacteraceae bacterium]
MTQQTKPISIVLADDHSIVREGLAAFCDARPELHIAGQCSDGMAAVEMIRSVVPDFAIIDLHMPKLHGLEVIRKVREANCPCKLVVLSISRDEKMVLEALRAGANGYLLKDGPARHLLDAITYIQDGGVYISPLLRREYLLEAPRKAASEDPLASLSRREYEVFSFLVDGMRPKDIAKLLDISPKTVDTYRSNIMRKLGIHDLVGLVKFAINRNLTSVSNPQVSS